MDYPDQFDVVVIGCGHAGAEACLAAARMGAKTLIVTHNIETIGQLSCNPSIGGIGKGHLVREIDAMGGAMGAVTDESGIQFRTLNSSKGPAVRATRAQIDRNLYRVAMRRRVERQKNLWIFQEPVVDLVVENGRAAGVVTQTGTRFLSKAVVLCSGTFLNGMVHVGLEHYSAGRIAEPPSIRLAERLKELGMPQGRLKTGTPARIDGRTIDFSKCVLQAGDAWSRILNIRSRSPAGKRIPMSICMPLFWPTWIAPQCMRGLLKVLDRATALLLKIRCSVLRESPAILFSWNRKA